MKKSRKIIILSLLLSPLVLFAAFNDVTLTSDAVLITVTLGSSTITFNVTGSDSSLENLTVYPGYFTARLLPGSSIKVSTADRSVINQDSPSKYVTTSTCNGTESSVAISVPSTDAGPYSIVEFSPSATICGAASGTGGGGAASAPAPAPAPVIVPAPAPRAALAPVLKAEAPKVAALAKPRIVTKKVVKPSLVRKPIVKKKVVKPSLVRKPIVKKKVVKPSLVKPR